MKRLTNALMAVLMVCMCAIPMSAMSENTSTAPAADNSGDVLVDVKTSVGDIRLKLFGITPKHRDNFVKLVKEGYYDGVLFHRVINEFMVQAGDPDSKNAKAGEMLGSGDPDYTIEAEIISPKLFHKRGALAAARMGDQVNPERRSSGSQFYIVTGSKFSESQLDRLEYQMEQQALESKFQSLAMSHRDEIIAMQNANDTTGLETLRQKLIAETEAYAAANPTKLTAEQREAYSTVGGAPHLDGQYTVFGEVVSGMDTVEKIEKAETDRNDRPKEDIRVISMSVVPNSEE